MKKGEKCVLTCRADYAYGDRAQGKIPAGATLKFEVELLSWTSLKKVTSDGAVQREIEMEGSGYDTPELLDEVTLEVTQLTPQQGETQTLHLPLLDDAEHVIKGIREAVREMKQGETSRIVIKVPSQYTHETEGVVCEDTQEEAVQYRLTLKELVPAKKTWDMSHEEKLERVQNRKAAGNELLKAGNLGRALDKYVQGTRVYWCVLVRAHGVHTWHLYGHSGGTVQIRRRQGGGCRGAPVAVPGVHQHGHGALQATGVQAGS
ncbi:MAG: hypothetical protein MHM6MM_004149 [Cercozoa sp. M6MM]